MKKIILISLLLNCVTYSTEGIGVNKVIKTALDKGTIFISSDGNGSSCVKTNPCNFSRLDLFSKNKLTVRAGDIVFFREGIYPFSFHGIKRIYLAGGKENKPIIYEAYNGEQVIFDGSKISRKVTKNKEWREGRLELRDSYTILRNIEIRNMPQQGLRIFGNHNIVEGCKIYANGLSGIQIYNHKDGFSTKATGGSFNIVRHNKVFENSDAKLKHHNYNNGDNADGITIHSGVRNVIAHNEVYANSDDGIDTWKSMNTVVEFNKVYKNGLGLRGNGNGIKLGGAKKESSLGSNAIARYNLSFLNKSHGININSGKNVVIEYNTVYKNAGAGYTLEDDTVLNFNIAFKNKLGDFIWSKGVEQLDNSWQLERKIEFLSENINSKNFLKPKKETTLNQIGAFAIQKK